MRVIIFEIFADRYENFKSNSCTRHFVFSSTMGSNLGADDGERPVTHCTQACYTRSTLSAIFSETVGHRENIDETKNMYFDKIYNFCLQHFSKFRLLAKINAK